MADRGRRSAKLLPAASIDAEREVGATAGDEFEGQRRDGADVLAHPVATRSSLIPTTGPLIWGEANSARATHASLTGRTVRLVRRDRRDRRHFRHRRDGALA